MNNLTGITLGAALFYLTVFVIGFAIVAASRRKVIANFTLAKLKNLSIPGGAKISGWWNEPKNKDALWSLIPIAGCLVVTNLLCAGFGWKWWLANWQHSPFWLSHFGILLAVFGVMSKETLGAKIFAVIVLAAVIGGWIWVAKRPFIHHIRKNEASKVFELSEIKDVEPLPLWVRINGSEQWGLYTPDRLENDLPKGTLTMQFKSEDQGFYIVEK